MREPLIFWHKFHGRAGREEEKGNVIIQTYNPESFPIECAREQDYLKFYTQEIELRRALKYPPFCDIIRIEVNDFEEVIVQEIMNQIYEKLLKEKDASMQIYAPMPSPIGKIKNRYRWRIMIKCILGQHIIDKINHSMQGIKLTSHTRITIDRNPNNMN